MDVKCSVLTPGTIRNFKKLKLASERDRFKKPIHQNFRENGEIGSQKWRNILGQKSQTTLPPVSVGLGCMSGPCVCIALPSMGTQCSMSGVLGFFLN